MVVAMQTKELTPRQIRERASREAEIKEEEENKPVSRAMETRNFYRKQAGWPPLRNAR